MVRNSTGDKRHHYIINYKAYNNEFLHKDNVKASYFHSI